MSKKIKTDYFSHDREKSKQPNIYYIIKTFGTIYYAYFWLITEKLYSLENYQIDLNNEDQLFCLVEELQLKNSNELKEIINIFVSKNVLSKKGDFIRSMDVDLQIKELEEKAERNRRNRTKDKDKQPNDNNDNFQTKPIETEKPITKEPIKSKLELPKVNPKYQKSRKELEEWISEELNIIPDFYHLKSNQQKKSLIGLFELVNIGLFDLRDMVSVSETLENFEIDATSLKNPSFYISNFYNELLRMINDNKKVGEENDDTGFYKRFAEKKFSYILSNDDSENKQLSYLDKYDSDDSKDDINNDTNDDNNIDDDDRPF